MAVLSIDVGLHTLAVCLLEHDASVPRIVHWDVLDLLSPPRCACGKPGKWTVQSVTYCGIHARRYPEKRPVVVPKVSGIQPQVLCRLVHAGLARLDEILGTVPPAHIVIERQPPKNAKMCMVSHFIMAYFVTRCESARIQFQPAKHKLATGPRVEDCHLKSKYAQRKYAAVKHTDHHLESTVDASETVRAVFRGARKKDDLADAFLQGLYFVQRLRKRR